jgi:hypothetical protein
MEAMGLTVFRRAIVLTLIVVLGACAKEWILFESPDGWRATFPGTPRSTETSWSFGNQTVLLPSYSFSAEPNDSLLSAFDSSGFYVAGAGRISGAAARPAVLAGAVRGFAEDLASVAGQSIVKEGTTEIRPGLHELAAAFKNGHVLRVGYMVESGGKMVFAATSNRRSNAMSPADGGRFLDSLQVGERQAP